MFLGQGRAQKFEKKGGTHFKAKPAGPDIFRPKTSEEQKKVITPADVQFSAQKQVKSKKKGSSRPQIVFYTNNITFT